MPKFQCLNESCIRYQEEVFFHKTTDIYDKKQDKVITKEAYCCVCGEYMDYIQQELDLKSIQAPKTGMMSHVEKMNMLKKRSKDLKIPANKEIAERKQYLDTH